jgi:hypothetical protein
MGLLIFVCKMLSGYNRTFCIQLRLSTLLFAGCCNSKSSVTVVPVGVGTYRDIDQLDPPSKGSTRQFVDSGLVWIPEDSHCGIFQDKNTRMIGYGLGRNIGPFIAG